VRETDSRRSAPWLRTPRRNGLPVIHRVHVEGDPVRRRRGHEAGIRLQRVFAASHDNEWITSAPESRSHSALEEDEVEATLKKKNVQPSGTSHRGPGYGPRTPSLFAGESPERGLPGEETSMSRMTTGGSPAQRSLPQVSVISRFTPALSLSPSGVGTRDQSRGFRVRRLTCRGNPLSTGCTLARQADDC